MTAGQQADSITFVCWKWTDPRGHRVFSSTHVNVLARAIARNYRAPHRFVCVTDDFDGLDQELVHPMRMPLTGFEHLLNPSERTQHEVFIPGRRSGLRFSPPRHRVRQAKPFPSCYRRLWNFSEEAAELLGPQIFAIDIDVIVVADLTPLVRRRGSFVGWTDERFGWNKVAGGAYMLRAGAHTDVWTEFDPETSPALAAAAGYHGSDQAWMSHKLHDAVPASQHWSGRDGLIKLKWCDHRDREPPPSARLIFTSGDKPPWDQGLQQRYPWIQEYWR